MDKFDKKIINRLQNNGRCSNAEIARKVGVSEGTVRRRLKRMVDEKFIRVVAQIEPGPLGYGSEALIGAQVDPDKIDQVADALSNLEEVNFVAITTGTYDIFAWATLRDSEGLGEFLRKKAASIEGVRRTETFVSLDVKKRWTSPI
jgi:Lrp/AsnC family transcriptional regulator for asnA, asnC and gidA